MENLIQKISNSIASKTTAIFCGAGISYNSGLPLVNELEYEILKDLDISGADASVLLNSNIPFEYFIETIRREVNIDKILEIFSKGEPNTNHDIIAKLAQLGLVKNILTTNFDLLIEKAFINQGLQRGTKFEVYSTEKDFSKINWNDRKIKIIKLHGCVSNKKEIAITLSAVANKAIGQNKIKLIKTFFSNRINPKVVIMGYSCSDLFDISPQIELIKGDNSAIYFIEHLNDRSQFRTEDISTQKAKNPFQSFRGKRIHINTDLFVKKIWEHLVKSKYGFKSSLVAWEKNIDDWINQSIDSDTKGVKHHLPARLYYNIGEYKISAKHFQKGMFYAKSIGNQVTFYSELGNLGMAFNALGKYKEAKECLETSIDACIKLENIQGVISQMQSLGNVYRNLADFKSALNVYKQAVLIAEKEQDLFSISTSIGNMVSIFTHMEDPDEAIIWLEKGLEIAEKIGNKQSEGSMLCHLGISYFQKGDNEKGKRYILESIKLTKSIGDKQGECMALHNLSNINLQMEEFTACILNASASFKIAGAIGIRQIEAGSMYNIGSSHFFKGEAEISIAYFKKSIETFREIYGNTHPHTQMAIKALIRAEKFPDHNKMTRMNFL